MRNTETDHERSELIKPIPYETFVQNMRTACIITDKNLEIIQINKSACHLLQCSDNRYIGKSIREFLILVPKNVLDYQLETLNNQGYYIDKWLIIDQLGDSLHVEFEALSEDDFFMFVMKDMTFYNDNEKGPSITTQQFQNMAARSTDLMVIFDRDGKIIDTNESFLTFLGITKDQIIGKSFRSKLTYHANQRWMNDWHELIKKGKITSSIEYQIGKTYYYFEISIFKNLYNEQFVGIFKDITEKRNIELQLKESKEIFKYVFEQANDAILLMNEGGVIIEGNQVAFKIFEVGKEGLVGENIERFIMRKDKRYYQIASEFENRGEIREELFYLMPNGQRKFLEFSSKKMIGTSTILTIFRNVSERYEMEVKLRKSEKRFRKIFDGMSDGLILWKDQEIVDVNHVGTKILRLPKKQIIEMGVEKLVAYIPQRDKELDRMLIKLEKQNYLEEVLSFTGFDGNRMYLEISTKKNLVSGYHLTVFKVVTEKLELQEQLRKSDTLSVVGELAAGIAHEIRNPMTALKGFIQLLQSSMKEDFSNYFEIITDELKRIDSIITEFLVLAKPQAIQFEKQDLNMILQDTVALLTAESMLYNIMFVKQLSVNPLPIYCEANQLKQVFINIMKNAIESMKDGGSIIISSQLEKEGTVKVTVKDEGYGIPEEKLKRLGEPFYTTKDRGTGLGLMVSYKIIEEHNGWIEVTSEEGKGTSFSIFLPCHLDIGNNDKVECEPKN